MVTEEDRPEVMGRLLAELAKMNARELAIMLIHLRRAITGARPTVN